jgi:hypothetical protein
MIALDFSPNEETQILAVAHQVGLAPAEYVMKLVKDHLPLVQTVSAPAVSKENTAAIAQLQAWLDEEATDDPGEIRQAEDELRELMQNLNRNRTATGERPVFS